MAKVNFIRKHTKAEVNDEPIVDGNFIVTGEGNVFIDYGKERIEIISSSGSITGDTLPIGSITAYGNETAPANWLICDGSAVSRTTYADLFAVIGTKYGAGDGSTTFNLPNLKGRVPVGLDGSDTDFNAIGKTDGEKNHTLTVYELPTKIPVNYGNISGGTDVVISSSVVGTGGVRGGQTNMNISATGQAHNNLQPYQVNNFIIKAFQSAGVVASVVNTQKESDTDVYSCNYINSLKPSIITAGLNNDIEITDNTLIQLDKILSSTGNKFTLQNGGIKIGAGVSKIKVSGCLLEEVNPVGLYGFYICKNEINLAHAINVGFNYIPVANQMVKTTCQPILADVQEGDVIYLNAYVNQSSFTATLQTYNGRTVNVTIEEVIE